SIVSVIARAGAALSPGTLIHPLPMWTGETAKAQRTQSGVTRDETSRTPGHEDTSHGREIGQLRVLLSWHPGGSSLCPSRLCGSIRFSAFSASRRSRRFCSSHWTDAGRASAFRQVGGDL